MDLLPIVFLLFFWAMPLLVFPLSSRCPHSRMKLWMAMLVLTSWAGLAIFVFIHYWLPERRKGPPSSWRAA